MRRLMLTAGLFTGCVWIGDHPPGSDTGSSGETGDPPLVATQVDFLILMDKSPSMTQYASGLGLATDQLVTALDNTTLDWRVGITEVTVNTTLGPTSDRDPGEAGSLFGAPVSRDDPGASDTLRQQLLCRATQWDPDALDHDDSFACGDAEPDIVHAEYLDCLCGQDAWQSAPGSGSEEHLEASYAALCRGDDAPPDDCFGDPGALTDADRDTNALFRPGAIATFVVFSDEGDNSRRMNQGDSDPATYMQLLGALGPPFRFAVMGPAFDAENDTTACNTGGTPSWAVRRLYDAAINTGGVYAPLVDDACEVNDPATFMVDLVETLGGELAAR